MGTPRPLLMMLDCTLRRQLRESTLWLLAGLYLAIVLAVIFPIGVFNSELQSRSMFQALQVLNLATAIFIAAFGGSGVVDDLASGTLELMKVAGLPPGRWIGFRFLSIVASYSVIWLLRLPLYSFLFNTGGCTIVDVLWSEVIDWAVLIGCAQTSLLIARFSSVEGGAIGTSIGLFCAANAALFLPSFALFLAKHLVGLSIPDSLQEIATLSKDLSLLTYLFSVPSMSESQLTAVGAVVLILLLGATATFWLRRLLYIQTEPGATEAAALPKASKGPTSRPSRRVG